MSLNDPQWGKRGGGSGPPDLDEIWRNVNRRLAELFGRKAPGEETPPEGPSGPKMKFPLGGAGLIVALALVVWLASGFYIVDEGRRGVVTRFGKYTETTLPGPRWHLPFPVEAVELVDFSQVKTIEVGKAKMDFVLYEGREQIAKQTEQLMQQMLDRYGTGIYVQKVTLQSVQPPEKVQAAFDDAVKAGQDRERSKNEGQAYANDVVPRARGQASRLSEEASGYKTEVVQRAEGDAARFRDILVEYQKAPGVTRDRLYLDMMQSVLGNSSKVLIDQKGGANLLNLPLDKLLQQGAAASAAASQSDSAASPPRVPATPEPAVTVDPARSRETLRNREGR